MGTKNYNNYSDMITFTRASSGTALAKISYGAELVTNGTFDADVSGWSRGSGSVDGTLVSSGGKAVHTQGATDATPRWVTTINGLTVGAWYEVSVAENSMTGSGSSWIIWTSTSSGTGGTDNFARDKAASAVLQATATTMYLAFAIVGGTTGSVQTIDGLSVKEVLYDQPDGTLQLFNHPTNQPRVEYDYQGNRLGLLVEEARTNVVTYSTITNANWTKYATTITDNAVVAPDGTQTAAKIISTQSGKGTCYLPGIPTGAYVDSFYAKAGTSNFFFIESPSTAPGVYFDLANGTVATITAGQTATIQYVGNGWFRCSVYATRTHGNISCGFSDADNNPNQANGNYGYVWGAQAELGSFPTSYIPTAGSTVTRAADVASIGVGAFGYNKGAGTVLVKFETPDLVQANALDIGSLDGANRIFVRNGQAFMWTDSATNVDITFATQTKGQKIGFAFTANDAVVSADGIIQGADTSVILPTSIDRLAIGSNSTTLSSQILNGHISSIAYYPRRLTDAQIKALTSPPETPTLSLTFDDGSTSYLETSIHG
jgi:hypothetical protein